MADITPRVVKIVSDQLGLAEHEITLESSFVDDLGADSLDTIELAMAFEDEFHLEIPDEDVETLRRVADAVSYLEARLEGRSP